MKYQKLFYKQLPKICSYKWSFYDHDTKLHCFTRGNYRQGFESCYLLQEDIDDQKNFNMMLTKSLSRSPI